MIIDIARVVVQIFGALIAVMCLWGLVAPKQLLGLVRRVADNSAGLGVAIAVRILLGAVLLTAAQVAKFPMTFTILGWVAIVAAIGLLIMGQSGMVKLVAWVARWPEAIIRTWLVFGLAFGAFLIYGA
jgi:hypothetical protein